MKEAAVDLRDLTVRYGSTTAVEAVSLEIEKSEFVTLLGPSGCGKTTLLRSIAGLVDPSAGGIVINGRIVNSVPIHKRNIGMVFQSYALFPHRSVHENIAFGLKYKGTGKSKIKERVSEILDIVRLPGLGDRMPSELSGGQQQRVALARALVIEPDVLLLDEPLSALDANLRQEMRAELKSIQRRLGVTTVFVTHDQEEALALSDKIVVMNQGRIEQVGSPQDIYKVPETRFVAEFVGQSNIFPGKISILDHGGVRVRITDGFSIDLPSYGNLSEDQLVEVVVRAQSIDVQQKSVANERSYSGEIRCFGIVVSVAFLGSVTSYLVDASGILVKVVSSERTAPLTEGESVVLTFSSRELVLFDGIDHRIRRSPCERQKVR